MRKRFFTAIAFLLAFMLFLQTFAFAEVTAAAEKSKGVYNIKINGELLNTDAPPFVNGKTSMLPVRAVFEKLGGKVVWNKAAMTMSITLEETSIELTANTKKAKINNKSVSLDTAPQLAGNRLMMPLSLIKSYLKMKVGVFPDKMLITIDSAGTLKDVSYLKNEGKDRIAFSLQGYRGCNIVRLTGPDRIVVDFPDTGAPAAEQKLNVSGSHVRSVRYSQYQTGTARVVVDVSGQPRYSLVEEGDKLYLDIDAPVFKGLTYYNNGDRVYFTINGAKLTDGGDKLKKFFNEQYENEDKDYMMTFPSRLARLEEGTMLINDGRLHSIEVKKSEDGEETTLILHAKDRFAYVTTTRPEVNNTAVTIVKPVADGETLVVIDAGHGGSEPGAIYGGFQEKNLNLDIAKRLNSLLKVKKVKTFMIREDDSYVGLYERGFIANALNASLFLSVHNNAIGDRSYGGTMTLYYPQQSGSSGFNGRRFAQIIQSKLLAGLKTTDRKIIERPNLVVLKATVMPAALAEVAFMTNAKDLQNLKNATFRQKAAAALRDAVLQALKEVG
jgi:N-acetylmuramoyl-L-alanine amidase